MQKLSKEIHEDLPEEGDSTFRRPSFLLKPLTLDIKLIQQTVDLGAE